MKKPGKAPTKAAPKSTPKTKPAAKPKKAAGNTYPGVHQQTHVAGAGDEE